MDGKTCDSKDKSAEEISLDCKWELITTSTQIVNAIVRGTETPTVKGIELPRSFKQACWEPMINKELGAMAEHAVWDIILRSQYDKPLPCAWKFSVKEDGLAKARLYLVGNREPVDSLQNTYALVADVMIVLWVCSMAVKH